MIIQQPQLLNDYFPLFFFFQVPPGAVIINFPLFTSSFFFGFPPRTVMICCLPFAHLFYFRNSNHSFGYCYAPLSFTCSIYKGYSFLFVFLRNETFHLYMLPIGSNLKLGQGYLIFFHPLWYSTITSSPP